MSACSTKTCLMWLSEGMILVQTLGYVRFFSYFREMAYLYSVSSEKPSISDKNAAVVLSPD
jgi:hypothetical protein